jgi:hypothetical protein
MIEQEILNDDFVLRQLTPAAHLQELSLAPLSRDTHERIEQHISRCVDLLMRHRGLHYRVIPDPDTEVRLLRRGLDIVGKTLAFEGALELFERVIEADWLAHVGLQKDKRYRDHISHPVRVTAIGWWLLHREHDQLLESMARHYERSTKFYFERHGLDLGGRDWKTVIEYAWLASGLLHDSAYPFEYHLRAGARLGTSDALRLIVPPPESFRGRGAARKIVDCLAGSWFQAQRLCVGRRLAELPDKQFKHSHALLGGLLHLAFTADALPSLRGLVRQLAARAILTHHDARDRDISSDPLAHLLFVADNLQFWGRPFVHASEHAAGGHVLRTLVECQYVQMEPRGEGYLARLVMNDTKEDMAILKGQPFTWTLEAFQQPNRRLQGVLAARSGLPRIELSLDECISPPEFLSYMRS